MDDVAPQTAARYRQEEMLLQFSSLSQPGNCPSGVYLAPGDLEDELEGVIFVHKGYYAGAILRFKIFFPLSFPSRAPIVLFEQGSLTHPLVDPKTSRMLISPAFPSWNPRRDSLSKLLWFIKGSFKRHGLDKLNEGIVANSEVWRIYQSNRQLFAKLATQCASVSSSHSALFGRNRSGLQGVETIEDNERGIVFHDISQEQIDNFRNHIFQA